jgi:hypothetical protein
LAYSFARLALATRIQVMAINNPPFD